MDAPRQRSRSSHQASAAGAARPAAGTVSVLVVDDQEVFRRAVGELIDATPGFEHVGGATSGPEGVRMASDLHPDLVLLEVRMHGMDGIETSRRLAAACPDSVVTLMSVESPADLPAAVRSCLHVRKQDLSGRSLRDVWLRHRPSRAS
jgi:chemotaxis response regulator CheB